MSDDRRRRASLGVKVWKSSQKWSVQRSAVRSIAWLGVCGHTDHVDHELWMGKHWNMATVDFVNGRAHTFRHKALQLRLHSAVASGHDIPARFGLPGHASRILVE